MHKVLFFLILAVSLAVIGRYAERIWHAGTLSHEKLSVFKEVWLAAATSCANCRISEFYAFDRGAR